MSKKSAREVLTELKKRGDPTRAAFALKYFKTGKGEYAEGDRFLGLNALEVRQTARLFRDLDLQQIRKLLQSSIHEARIVALLILVDQFQTFPDEQKTIFDFYIENRSRVNNWDLVDCSASYIVGAFLNNRNRKILKQLARSESLWDRRIAIISTHYFIRNGEVEETFRISEMLLRDREDLIHKAVGWMLREAGKKDVARLQKFLEQNYSKIPRTTLRYAIERFPDKIRRSYLTGN